MTSQREPYDDREAESEPAPPPPAVVGEWKDLGLSADLLALLEKAGFKQPTAVQTQAIPVAMKGKDLIASARTGSGKTAAFSLPMIQAFAGRRGTYGLVLCPTREIALQTQETLELFGIPLGVRSVPLIGGTDVKTDERALLTNPQILVGTPGRICDHLDRGNLWLEFIETLVLDEADRMLDMGFSKELSRITKETPKNRQTLLFSATISPTIEKLTKQILNQPERVAIGSPLSVSASIDHEILWMNDRAKKRELVRLIHQVSGPIIVFTRTKDGATNLWRSMHSAGIYDSTYISSNKSQAHREEALQGFKDGKYRVLVATDIAGRGIHVENVGLVVNFDLPREPEDYIHRIGRTGRKDARGLAVSFVTPDDLGMVCEIEEFLGERLTEYRTPDFVMERSSRSSSSRGGSRGGRKSGSSSGRPRSGSGGGRSSGRRHSRR